MIEKLDLHALSLPPVIQPLPRYLPPPPRVVEGFSEFRRSLKDLLCQLLTLVEIVAAAEERLSRPSLIARLRARISKRGGRVLSAVQEITQLVDALEKAFPQVGPERQRYLRSVVDRAASQLFWAGLDLGAELRRALSSGASADEIAAIPARIRDVTAAAMGELVPHVELPGNFRAPKGSILPPAACALAAGRISLAAVESR